MKIVQAGPFPIDKNLIKGGVESSVYGISDALSLTNEVFVIDYPRFGIPKDSIQDIDNYIVCRFKSILKHNNANVFRLFAITKTIKKFQPDICHLHSTSLLSLLLFCTLKIQGIQVVVTVHGLSHIEKRNLWTKKRNIKTFIKYIFHSFYEFTLLNIANQIIVDTEYVAERIREYKSQRKIWRLPKMYVIPQGISELYFDIKCDLNSRNLLAVGSIHPRKGHLELIKSMELVFRNHSEVTLNIVGNVSDLKYLEDIIAKINESGLQNNIRVYTNLNYEGLIKLYKVASIFVLHTQEESQGIVFCEALACGMPIVSTNVGGVPFVVDEGKGGNLVDFLDFESFARAVELLLENSQLCLDYSKYNSLKANQYHWDNIAKKVIDLYTLILN